MERRHGRIEFLDIMRGIAIVVMVIGHSIDSVLSDGARATEAFRLYDAVRGFTAPIFLFVAGFAFTIATERRWDDYRRFSRPLRGRILKILALLIIGYGLHLPYFSLTKLVHETGPSELAQLLQADVLHCVAASLLTLQILVLFSPSLRVFGMLSTGLTALAVLATPLVWITNVVLYVGPVLAPYFNQSQTSIFPVFPFGAFLFSGAALGHFYLTLSNSNKENKFGPLVFKLAVAAGLCGFLLDLVPLTVYPAHDYWKASPNFFLVRLSAVLFVTVAFVYLRKLPVLIERPVVTLGQASLLVYATHLVVVYGSPANIGMGQLVGRTLPYAGAVAVGVAVLCGMILLAHFWTHVRRHHLAPSRFVQAGFASTIVYLFVTNPW
jgi:peptidoglycan/LPS O-acetylase OafA/YrhL